MFYKITLKQLLNFPHKILQMIAHGMSHWFKDGLFKSEQQLHNKCLLRKYLYFAPWHKQNVSKECCLIIQVH